VPTIDISAQYLRKGDVIGDVNVEHVEQHLFAGKSCSINPRALVNSQCQWCILLSYSVFINYSCILYMSGTLQKMQIFEETLEEDFHRLSDLEDVSRWQPVQQIPTKHLQRELDQNKVGNVKGESKGIFFARHTVLGRF